MPDPLIQALVGKGLSDLLTKPPLSQPYGSGNKLIVLINKEPFWPPLTSDPIIRAKS